eukprot:14243557-Ditylum_brightwellii.AAC.1
MREYIGLSKKYVYTSIKDNNASQQTSAEEKYKHKKRKVTESEMAVLQKKCVLEFCHSDDASRIDTNAHWTCK